MVRHFKHHRPVKKFQCFLRETKTFPLRNARWKLLGDATLLVQGDCQVCSCWSHHLIRRMGTRTDQQESICVWRTKILKVETKRTSELSRLAYVRLRSSYGDTGLGTTQRDLPCSCSFQVCGIAVTLLFMRGTIQETQWFYLTMVYFDQSHQLLTSANFLYIGLNHWAAYSFLGPGRQASSCASRF